LLARRNATVVSTNWSGYAVVANGITDVRSTFVVPKTKAFPSGFASTWTGIGGYNTGDLIQAGVAEEAGGNYYAWYEILPASATPITGCSGDAGCSVRPGDKTYIRILQVGTNLWNVLIINNGHGVSWRWSRDIPYKSSRSSAEWVLEAPTVGGAQSTLQNVGNVHFGPQSLYKVGNGAFRTIAAGNPVRIVLQQAGVRQATPSALGASGQQFNDCSYKRTCPAP
jgi:hypothetical protein